MAKKLSKRVALNWKVLNIKSEVTKGVLRLIRILSKSGIAILIVFSLLGYYPTFAIPPIRTKVAIAGEPQQSGEVISTSFPTPIILPHPGYLSTVYSNYHPGVDIATGLGMPIHPINPGVVEEIAFGFWGYGNYVLISHQDGYKSMYAHMGRVYVAKDQNVTSETILGEVGLTGWTSGPHTHLEITKDGKHIDPMALLPNLPNFPTPDTQRLAKEGSLNDSPEYSRTLKPDLK